MINVDSILKSRDITLPTKVCLIKAMVFPVAIYGCESWTIKKAWTPKIWCFWTVVLEKTLENPLDSKKIQPVHPKGNQSWIFIGRTDAEAETSILWLLDAKNWLIRKDPDAGKDWKQEENGMTEDEMVGWHHWLDGYGYWWWTGKTGVLQSMGSQRVGHNWATELNLVAQPCLILCDCNPPGSSVHGDSPKNTGEGCHAPFPVIFPFQGSKPVLLHCGQIL